MFEFILLVHEREKNQYFFSVIPNNNDNASKVDFLCLISTTIVTVTMKDENIVNIDTQSHCEKWTLKPLFTLA